MNSVPDTRVSLIVRLPGGSDFQAWQEFTETYEPFVMRFARRRGLQDADARELVQEVFIGVAKAVKRWEPDATRAKFRTWLFRIAKNQLVTLLARQREAGLDTDDWNQLAMTDEPGCALSQLEDQQYRDEVFQWASQQVRRAVSQQTWHAFWETSVVGRSVDDVASELGVNRGIVYVARSRTISKLRAEIARFESETT